MVCVCVCDVLVCKCECVICVAVQVHPSCSYLAVGEKGQQPVIAIYAYPELRLHRVLRGESLPGWREVHSSMSHHWSTISPPPFLSSSFPLLPLISPTPQGVQRQCIATWTLLLGRAG